MTIDKSLRGKAFPQPSINFKIPLIWECYAQNSQRRDNLKEKGKIEKIGFSLFPFYFWLDLQIVAQMQNPYIREIH